MLLPGSLLRWQDSGHESQVYLPPALFSTLLPIWVTGWQAAAGHVTQRSEALNNASFARFYPLVEENGAECEHSWWYRSALPSQSSKPHALCLKHTFKMALLSPCTSGRSKVLQTPAVKRGSKPSQGGLCAEKMGSPMKGNCYVSVQYHAGFSSLLRPNLIFLGSVKVCQPISYLEMSGRRNSQKPCITEGEAASCPCISSVGITVLYLSFSHICEPSKFYAVKVA